MIAFSIAIVDDDKVDCMLCQTIVHKAADTLGISIRLRSFENGRHFLESADSVKFDIIFMDILMKDPNGIETARLYKERNPQSIIIFLTASPEHRKNAFSVHAFDYIEKPVREDAIIRVFHDIRMITVPAQQKSLELKAHKQTYNFVYTDIQYIVSEGNYIKLFIKQNLKFRANFKDTAKQLMEDARFIQINKGILVNLDWIERINADASICTMKSMETFPIAKKNASALKRLLTERGVLVEL